MQKILGHESWKDMESPIFIYSSLAQSVERTAVNRDVVGSSPTRGANLRSVLYTGFFCIHFVDPFYLRIFFLLKNII